jgi:hypothetical protein
MESPSVRGIDGLGSLLSHYSEPKQRLYQKTFETKGLSNVINEEIRSSVNLISKTKRKVATSTLIGSPIQHTEERNKSTNVTVVPKEQPTENQQVLFTNT